MPAAKVSAVWSPSVKSSAGEGRKSGALLSCSRMLARVVALAALVASSPRYQSGLCGNRSSFKFMPNIESSIICSSLSLVKAQPA